MRKGMDNLLLLGGAGFLGSNLVGWLSGRFGGRIVVLEPEGADVSRIAGRNVILERGSLADESLIRRIVRENRVDCIVHMVSTMVPGGNYEDFRVEQERVLEPTFSLIRFCAAEGIRFVFFSSGGTVYGDGRPGERFREDAALSPKSYYGIAKRMVEEFIQFEHRTDGLSYLILRPSNPYGPGQRPDGRQGLIAVALGKVLSGESLSVWGDGQAVRDYIYIDDLVDSVSRLLLSDVSDEVINIGSGTGRTVNEVLDTVRAATGRPLAVRYVDKRKEDVSSVVLSVEKLGRFFKRDLVGLEDGIRRFYEYLQR